MAQDQDQLAPHVLLTRKSLAEALGARGLRISAATLATKSTRGGGPPYTLFCGRALYRWSDALAWAEAQLATPYATTSERETAAR